MTPGPWVVEPWNVDEPGPIRVLAVDERQTIVAEVTGAHSNPTAIADAILIAAAPALAAALAKIAGCPCPLIIADCGVCVSCIARAALRLAGRL